MNRRAFVSMLAGLPVIGKYWKQEPKPMRILRYGTTVECWGFKPKPQQVCDCDRYSLPHYHFAMNGRALTAEQVDLEELLMGNQLLRVVNK